MNMNKGKFKEIVLKDKINLLDSIQTEIGKLFHIVKEAEIKRSKLDKMAAFDLDTVFPGNDDEQINPKLSFSYSGKIVYKYPSGNTYRSDLNKNNNAYKLLFLLVQNPYRYFSVEELNHKLNKQREGANATPERRVRDTIQEIREGLGLNKEHPHDFFTVKANTFGINCDSEITQ